MLVVKIKKSTKTSEKIVDNVKERKDEFEKEEKAFDKSEAQYKKVKSI